MMQKGKVLVFLIILLLARVVFADPEPTAAPEDSASPKNVNWLFSGTALGEGGERYSYFFKMDRRDSNFHAQAALFDAQSKQLLLFYEQTKAIEQSGDWQWNVGKAFLSYNPINESWVFGVKPHEGLGFNFKTDMLGQAEDNQSSDILRDGVHIEVKQTSRLNGHIQIGKGSPEQFVTSNHTWFSKLWLTEDQQTAHRIRAVFCRMNNFSGFYAVNLEEDDAKGAALAQWRDPEGALVKMSQFVNLEKLSDQDWSIQVSIPKTKLIFTNLLAGSESNEDSAGFFNAEEKGFCFIANQMLG